VVSLFYDHKWWQETLESSPPGFIGSGDGVREVLVPSMVGFAVKFDFEKAKKNLKRFDDFKNLGSKQRDRAN
jgi:hypothetical protein